MNSYFRPTSSSPHPADENPANGLLLGWNPQERKNHGPFGFTPENAAEVPPTNPLTYAGDGHLLTVAPTGAGKGVSEIIPALLEYPGPIITVDPKGENYAITARRRREMGHQVVCLDPFGIITSETDRFNPLDLCFLSDTCPEHEVEMMSELLASGKKFGTDPYWDNTAMGLNSGVLMHILESEPLEKRTLTTLRDYLNNDEMDMMLAQKMDRKAIKNRWAYQEIAAYLALPGDKTRPCVRATAQTYLRVLGSEAVSNVLGPSTFSLNGVVRGDLIDIYIVLPPNKLDSHRALLQLWVGSLLSAVTSRREIPDHRTLFLLDECAQLGTLAVLKQAISLMRGYGLQVWTFWQSLAQMRQLYPVDWQTMLDNATIFSTFGLTNYRMAVDCAEFLGEDPSDLMTLPSQDKLVHVAGTGSLRCRRPDYRRDPEFHGMYDANPRFHRKGRGSISI